VDDDRQLLRGVLRLLLLDLIAQERTYGYALVMALRDHGLEQAGESTIYPALSRLEKEGLLEAHLEASGQGAARKYYQLTDDGQTARANARQAWQSLQSTVAAILTKGDDHEAP
jgi:PadR family transcriptional regulator, regulatory protein PadR